jgi:hypothetical protein
MLNTNRFLQGVYDELSVYAKDCDHAIDMYMCVNCDTCIKNFSHLGFIFVKKDKLECEEAMFMHEFTEMMRGKVVLSDLKLPSCYEGAYRLQQQLSRFIKRIDYTTISNYVQHDLDIVRNVLAIQYFRLRGIKRDFTKLNDVCYSVDENYGTYFLPDKVMPMDDLIGIMREKDLKYIDGIIDKDYIFGDEYKENCDVVCDGKVYHYRKLKEADDHLKYVIVQVYDEHVEIAEDESEISVETAVQGEFRILFVCTERELQFEEYDVYTDAEVMEGFDLEGEAYVEQMKRTLSLVAETLDKDVIICTKVILPGINYIFVDEGDICDLHRYLALDFVIGCRDIPEKCYELLLSYNRSRDKMLTDMDNIVQSRKIGNVGFDFKQQFGVRYFHVEPGENWSIELIRGFILMLGMV